MDIRGTHTGEFDITGADLAKRGHTAKKHHPASAHAHSAATPHVAHPVLVHANLANATPLVANANGVVVLPEGATLDDVSVVGRDLVITLADGHVYVITDGAVYVPEIEVAGVVVPPLNLSALLIGHEPQPAAGSTSSSGGNFADPVGNIQPAYDLGNLLPYTELQFPQPTTQELFPALNRLPTTSIITPDQPLGATDATSSVDESGLPARGNEPAGSDSAANSEFTSGTIVYDSPDGLSSITVNGVAVTAVNETITTSLGVMTITGIADGAIQYSYQLADNSVGPASDVFTVVVTDPQNDQATAKLTITIVDDAPIARPDTDLVHAGTYGPETGNVMTGAGTTSGTVGADTQGADGASVFSIASNNVPANTDSSFDANNHLVVAGQYGMLTMSADGSYSYTRNANTPGGVTDTFTYTLHDADNSASSSTLTISIGDSPVTITGIPSGEGGNTVFEAGLPARPGEPAGSESASNSETTSGTITFTSPDGVGSVAINGTTITGANQVISTATGNLTITSIDPAAGTIGYSFTLTDNTSGDNTSVSFNVTVTDLDGDSDTRPLVIHIVDDVPTAHDDTGAVAAGTYGPATGNVIANDTQGADGAHVVSYVGATSGNVGDTIQGQYGTLSIDAAGNYSYTRDAGTPGGVQDSFTYRIQDGDGDQSTAHLVISIGDSTTSLNLPVAGTPGVTEVFEAGLPTGSNAASNSEFASGTFTFTAPDGPAIITIGGTTLTGGVQTIHGAHGDLTITGISGGTVSYTYQLTSNTSGDNTSDAFTVNVADQDNDSTTSTLTIAIVDDVPTAKADVDSVTEDGPLVADGNVLTATGGSDANTTDGVADVQGADGAHVIAIAFDPVVGSPVAGTLGAPLAGAYGSLTLSSTGAYTYTLDNTNPLVQGLDGHQTLTETFTYTIQDGDGDQSSTTLTVTINGADDPVVITGLSGAAPEEIVYEANLSDGSSPDAAALTQTGTFDVSGQDGITSIAVGGHQVYTAGAFVPGQTVVTAYGTLTITGVTPVKDATGDTVSATVSYSYTLADNTLLHTGTNDVSLIESIPVSLSDTDGSTATASLDIKVVDDVPTAHDDGPFTVGEQTPITINALANDTFGADGVSYATGVAIATNPTKGTVTYDPSTHLFTYTPNAGASGSDSFTYTITDGDGDHSTATVTLTLAADSVPNILSTPALAVDEDGLPGANIDSNPLQSNPQEVAGTGSATATGTATVDFGADKPANLPASITLVDTAALDGQFHTLSGQSVVFDLENGALVGRAGSAAGTEVIRISITGAVSGALPGQVVYTFSATLSQPIAHPVAGTEDVLTLTGVTFHVTDSDGSPGTGTFTVSVRDDVPSIELDKGNDAGVVLTTHDAATIGANFDTTHTSAGFGGVFTINNANTTAGADGQKSLVTNYTLGITNAASGLSSHGAAITLYQLADGTVVGSTAGSNPGSVNASVVFSVGVASDGTVTLTQYQQIDHALPGATAAPYDTQDAVLADGHLTLTATATLTDGDNDVATSSQTVDLGHNIQFADDGPSFTGVSAGGTVTLDETTAGSPAGYGVNGISQTSLTSVISATAAFGADGPAASNSLVYGLAITGGGTTPITTSIGGYAVSLVQIDGTTIQGQYTDSGNVTHTAFSLVIGSDGKLTVTEFVPLHHANPADSNDQLTLVDALGHSLVSATVTATDYDGDSARASAAIGANVIILDDGPTAAISVAGLHVSLDESAGLQADSNDVLGPLAAFASVANVGHDPDTGNAPVGYAQSNSSVAGDLVGSTGTIFGADGGSAAFSVATVDGTNSGLKTTDGSTILLYNEGGLVVGRVGSAAGAAAFAVAIDASTGVVSVVEYLSLQNPDSTNPDDVVSITNTAITAMVTATDNDGDHNTASASIGSLIQFQDSGPIMTAASNINIQNSGDFAASGTFAYNLGADGAPTDNNVFVSVTGSASVNNTATQNFTITENPTESASSVSYAFSFDYAVGNGTTSHETGTLIFDKAAGTYTVDLDAAIKAFVTVDTQGGSAFVGYEPNSSTVDSTSPVVAVTTLMAESAPNAHDGFYVQFTGFTAGNGSHETISNPFDNPAAGDGVGGTWVAGELFSEGNSVQNSWVSVSNSSNGVGGDTINGPDALNFDLFSSNPTGTTGNLPTASSDSMYLTFDGVGASDDLIVVVKLWSDTNGNGIIDASDAFTTKAILVQSADIYRFDGGHLAATTAALAGSPYASVAAGIAAGNGSNNDGLVIIESNDYNSGGSHWQIVGAQIVNTADGVSGTGVNLNPAVGAGGASTTTESFSDITDTSPLKITNIGFSVPSATAQSASLSFAVTIQDGDGDKLTQPITATVTSSPDSSTPVALSPTVTAVVPIVVDLDGNGAQFLPLSAGVTYNYFGQNYATAWAAPGDGILAIDLNHDGKVSSASEFVFGGNGLTDLQGLAATYDTNHDGVLDGKDADFASFGVWQDANSNGVADPGEFHTLAQLGITSISLISNGQTSTAAGGDVTVTGTSTVTLANGTTTTAADASFAISRLSQQVESAVTTAAASSLVTATTTTLLVTDTAPHATTTTADTAPTTPPPSETPAIVDGPQPKADFGALADKPAAQAPQTDHDGQHLSDPSAKPAGLADLSDHSASSGLPDAGADSGTLAPAIQAAAMMFGSPANVQAMDALLVAAAHAGAEGAAKPGPDVAQLAQAVVGEAVADGHAAGFVDGLLAAIGHGPEQPGNTGAAPASVDLAALMGSHVDAHTMAPVMPVIDLTHLAVEAAAAAHA